MTTSIFVGLVKITVLRIRKFLAINLRLMLIDLNIKKLHLIEMIWSGMNLSCFGIEGINFVKNHSFKDWSSLGQLIVPCIQYVIRNCTSIHEHFISWLKSTWKPQRLVFNECGWKHSTCIWKRVNNRTSLGAAHTKVFW